MNEEIRKISFIYILVNNEIIKLISGWNLIKTGGGLIFLRVPFSIFFQFALHIYIFDIYLHKYFCCTILLHDYYQITDINYFSYKLSTDNQKTGYSPFFPFPKFKKPYFFVWNFRVQNFHERAIIFGLCFHAKVFDNKFMLWYSVYFDLFAKILCKMWKKIVIAPIRKNPRTRKV